MPDYFPEGNAAKPWDNELRSLHKLVDLANGGTGAAGVVLFGANANPNGVKTAIRPAVYYTASALWVKTNAALDDSGWAQLV